ncbi:MAG TPA: hypothetical protein VLO11_03910 [Luteolibacter sp.]|nr:hypothetical protein [Luteolibacter sp.]
MTDSKKDSLNELLAGFELGPAWAKATAAPRTGTPEKRGDARSQGEPRERDGRGRRSQDRGHDDDSRKPFRGRGPGRRDDRREGPPRPQQSPPAEGVRVTLVPDAEAIHLIGKEVHQVARVYPLFDVARILLAERGRCRAVFEASEPHPPLFRGKLDDSLFLTREEAVRHLWHSELRARFIAEETVEVDPPSGNFQLVARCGLSGEWLGPPNFHSYQTTLRRLHRERFSHMPFEAYSAKVRTERGEEAINAWLETQKKKTRWRLKDAGDDAWTSDPVEAGRTLAAACFDEAFEETRRAELLASVPPANLSPSLMTSLKIAGNHARNHPAMLIPAVCKAVEAEHLPVFKRQGKLYTGPARPHPLPQDAVLAERPGIMVEWIRANPPAKLEGLWKAVLPEGATAPPAEFAADLFWLLHQGHILLFTDDTLVVQETRAHADAGESGANKPAKKKKRKGAKATTGDTAKPASGSPETQTPPADTSTAIIGPVIAAPVVQGPVVETPVIDAPVVQAPVVETDFSSTDESSPADEAVVDETPAL